MPIIGLLVFDGQPAATFQDLVEAVLRGGWIDSFCET
jgi:hypothetical protein